jgi:Flp pilus assembly protein TadD
MPTPTLELSATLAKALSLVGDEYLVRCMRHEVGIHPTHLGALSELGHALTRLGRYDEGLVVDRALVELCPSDPLVHYNLACSLCLLGQHDAALAMLQRASELGYAEAEHLLQDEDLLGLRDDPRFLALVEQLRCKPSS